MTIKFIFFDMGNVLLNFDHQRMITQVASAAQVSEDLVDQTFFHQPHSLENRFEEGEVNCEQFHAKFCEVTGSGISIDALELAIADIFWVNTEIIPVIAQLRSRNYPMAILSNTCPSHWEFALQHFAVVGKLFDQSILSYEVKSMKPDAGIYTAAIKMADCAPENIFFTDDKLENVEAAKAAGMTATVFESAGGLIEQLQQLGVEMNL